MISNTHRWLPIGLVVFTALAASAAEFETIENIRTVAEQHARQRLPHVDRVEAVSIDERLRLKRCSEPLQAHSKAANNRSGLTVEVSCTGPHPWKLYVPVRASSTLSVVVATKGLGANQVLSLQDVRLEPRATGGLPYGFFTNPNDIIGARMRRTVATGTVLVPAALAVDKLVRRGQRVTLVRDANGIMVKGSGIALSDGARAQRIQVKTPSSRIVEGTVISADIVKIGG